MTPDTHPTFHDAYPAVLRRVLTNPDHEISTRNNPAVEVLDVSYRIADPRQRVPYLLKRPINLAYNWGELLWYMSGRDDVDMIAYYAPVMRTWTPDGKTLTGTAYGRRLFVPGRDGRTQWQRVMDLLEKDPDSKRGVLAIFDADELAIDDNPDMSCTLGAHMLLRDGTLHMTCYMRANDSYLGMPSDVFTFTTLQELAANLLGARLGHYTHHVGSMHVNSWDQEKVRGLLSEVDDIDYQPPNYRFPIMPADRCMESIRLVIQEEEALRLNQVQHTPKSVAHTGLAWYWQQVLLVLEAYRQIKHTSEPVNGDVLDVLHPGYRWLIQQRWPDRMPEEAA
ncbi:thymidylate synthase [Nonomuraea sp. NPDC049504]|uniref:thymidylate synthase n=1 Tax=Nonomuraea sp. NPDC049504 TaxID=3154729 RepID=UPI0034409F1D